ncbi:MAG: PAS domain S-box protein, partial [Methanomicrobia archaeon]|nr:PAS domain S-box protein [Methanomicrobia archaeon]
GPIRGALIMGRYLDSGEIEDLGETTQVSLSAHRFDDSQLPSDFKAAESFLSEDAHIFIQPLSEESIAGYALLEDIYGQPALVLKVDMPRSIYGQGQATVNYFILLILAIGLMFSVAVLLFLNKFVLAPLSRLSDGVSSIGASSDLSHRVPISGRDEFSKLGGTINETLASLEQSQRALQESEEKYSTFFKTSRDPVFITSRDGRWLDFNEAMVEILGYENRDELMKVNVPDLYANPDERGQHIKTIEEQGFSKEYPVNLRRKDGGIINTLITSVVKKDEAGNVMGFQGTIRDVTERKRWEEERARAEKRQLHLIKELERVNEELKDFAYIISHDLKAPLRAITSLAQWISEDYADKLDNEGKELLDLLMSRVKRMHALIDGVLEYSRIGRLEEEKSEVDLNTLVSGVIDLIQPPETIDIDIVDQLPTIYCEKTRMEQVFQNLLSNAVRYMDEPEGKVRIGCTEEDGYWKFSVADNGPGIEEKYYKDIFQMFQTLKPRDEVESTGVGLTIAKKIVESQGGEIWVESKVGEGSTFFFTVPKEAGGDNHEKGRLDTPGRR